MLQGNAIGKIGKPAQSRLDALTETTSASYNSANTAGREGLGWCRAVMGDEVVSERSSSDASSAVRWVSFQHAGGDESSKRLLLGCCHLLHATLHAIGAVWVVLPYTGAKPEHRVSDGAEDDLPPVY
jgi:hypothetical protein